MNKAVGLETTTKKVFYSGVLEIVLTLYIKNQLIKV